MSAEPLQVWRELDLVNTFREQFRNVSSGDKLELDNTDLISGAFPDSDRTVEVKDGDGNLLSDSDYSVGLSEGSLVYNGSGSKDLTITYRTAPVENSVCEDALKSGKQEIEDRTGTVFGRTETKVERYDRDSKDTRLKLWHRPVDTVSGVYEFNNPVGEDAEKTELEQGRAQEFYRFDLGIAFTHPRDIAEGRQVIEIEYSYGYEQMPQEIEQVQKSLAMKRLLENSTVREVIEGRDDYDPSVAASFINDIASTIDRYKISRINEMPPTEV